VECPGSPVLGTKASFVLASQTKHCVV
jgi:hypothetical protein